MVNDTSTTTFDLSNYQAIFNEEDTSKRCRNVLDNIHVEIKPFFDKFCEENNLLTDDRYIKDYSVTLNTTYHDAKNPKNEEAKKNSSIGKKYYIALNQKIGNQEVNLITLEFNGVSKKLHISIDTDFYPVWYEMKTGRMIPTVESLDDDVLVQTQGTWYIKESFPKDDFYSVFTEIKKQKKTTFFHFGIEMPLEGTINKVDLNTKIISCWEKTTPIRKLLKEEKELSNKAEYILDLFSNEWTKEGSIQVLNQSYSIVFGKTERYKPRVRRQSIAINDNNQLITKGHFYYLDRDQNYAPNQVIAVNLEGHFHIYTDARELLGSSVNEWWIRKMFSAHKKDNSAILIKAMSLLEEHGIPTKDSKYYMGSYNNETNVFNNEILYLKQDLIKASIIFAVASERLKLGQEVKSDITPNEEEEFVSNFSFKDIYETFAESQFTFSIDIIRDFHLNLTALDDKHFVILNGISGTGKTQLCRLYANAVYGLDYESENPYLTIIPVRPDWMDATALFGYYSSFEKKYIKTEFLQVLLSAQKERDKPHFIVLDEMNLARVEYYLSDYLSAVESRKEILLHNREDVMEIPQKISIPPNVYVLGTINVDETTHSLSDKVLDRAFVMTLSDVDFNKFWSTLDYSVKSMVSHEFDVLRDIHDDLKSYELHFGYRTMNEMIQKLIRNKELEEHSLDSSQALDRVISEKVLPKLRGDERISDLLSELRNKCLNHFGEESLSHTHLVRMEKELERYGATQFWR
ncbi:AAA family ATPase [Fictibacillus sp. 5RED26]|uniref:McrB family protein n=1 Tax=Fictibacillus sp. 5RED26 TaxID=2745876 RepID=UPI0018CDF93D|nr:AAA family ATPase [Fictibacillus sp. 5RED26]MBH0157317.1 AAA family ATPase [Fictibacillus sp. 5RED26]